MTNTQNASTPTPSRRCIDLFLEALRDMIDEGLITIPRADTPTTPIGYQHRDNVYLLPWETLSAVTRYLADHGISQSLHLADLEQGLIDAGVIEIMRYSRKFPMPDTRITANYGYYRTAAKVWRLIGL